MNINDIYTVPEAAKKWGITEPTLKRHLTEGKFKPKEARKSGGTWLIAAVGLNRLYGAQEQKGSGLGGEKRMLKDVTSSAAALFDGGWRSGDKDELIKEYNLSDGEAEEICEELKKYELRVQER